MRLKSAYREPARKIPVEGPPSIPKVEIDGQPAAGIGVSAELSPDAEPNEAVAEAMRKADEADAASLSLRRQLEHLRASEQAQRMAAQAQAHAEPPTRSQLLQLWRAQGMSEAEQTFLESNPELIDNPRLTAPQPAKPPG